MWKWYLLKIRPFQGRLLSKTQCCIVTSLHFCHNKIIKHLLVIFDTDRAQKVQDTTFWEKNFNQMWKWYLLKIRPSQGCRPAPKVVYRKKNPGLHCSIFVEQTYKISIASYSTLSLLAVTFGINKKCRIAIGLTRPASRLPDFAKILYALSIFHQHKLFF